MEDQEKNNTQQELPLAGRNTVLRYSDMLRASKNIIFHGAPGTGKTYLANQIAAYIVSQGRTKDRKYLTDKEEEQVEFVQFHPSYDYTDFVEGLRPTKGKEDGSIGFERKDGIFMEFVKRAQKEDKDSRGNRRKCREDGARETLECFLEKWKESGQELFLWRNTPENNKKFTISIFKENYVAHAAHIPDNGNSHIVFTEKHMKNMAQLLESGKEFPQPKDIKNVLPNFKGNKQLLSYYWAICKAIREENPNRTPETSQEKKYVFIIDEINRGEISKIFGELFFAIDPDYRGHNGEIKTQYANLHSDPNEKFYIPENVYIIGTMNDIDKSVDSFDFAMRRRFRFIELPADEKHEMLTTLGDKATEARSRMKALNNCIRAEEGLNAYYQIGPAYFLKLKYLEFDFKRLWEDHLEPLLRMYIQGIYCGEKEEVLNRFKEEYEKGI
ncbi:MAG: AAA family ATPase [Akkermansiaceae bacterium]|nr:AAA family ATPase [Akkermansiaceae bacterium]